LLISPDGVAPGWIVSVSASVIFPCTIKSRRSLSSGTGSPGWSWKKGPKTVVCACLSFRSYCYSYPPFHGTCCRVHLCGPDQLWRRIEVWAVIVGQPCNSIIICRVQLGEASFVSGHIEMVLNSLQCADMPLRNHSLTQMFMNSPVAE